MVGEKLGSFRIEGTLGVGAMGVVYKATNESTGKPAAVKVVNSEIAQKGKTYERFRREAEILQQFRHSNIVRFLAVGRYQGTSYFAMEFIQGQTLEQLLNERGAMEWQEVVELAIQIAEALHYAHEHGVVHRDLKPSNLMVTDAGRIKLTDFGIAKDLDKTALTATGRTLGTAAYMAPEQIRGTPEVSHKTDLYALGIVLYQALTGVPPFEGNSAVVLMHAHLNGAIPRPSGKVAEIPRALDDLVIQLMAKSPQDRPWDAAAAALKLTEIRDKVNRGESIPMVWATAESVGGAAETKPAKVGPKGSKKGKKSSAASSRYGSNDSETSTLRRALESSLLVLGLVGILGFVGYMFWPPSKEYLFKQAEVLMEQKDRHAWTKAVKEYLDPLDERFPDNPYKETTTAWRDRLLLDIVEGRAKVLESPIHNQLTAPKTPNEEKFVLIHNTVMAAEQSGDDHKAAEAWEEMARQLDSEQPEDRPWHLLAKKRAATITTTVAKRRDLVQELVDAVNKAILEGETEEAAARREAILKQYGQYKDLSDLLGVPEGNSAQPKPETPAPKGEENSTPEPPPANSSTTPNPQR